MSARILTAAFRIRCGDWRKADFQNLAGALWGFFLFMMRWNGNYWADSMVIREIKWGLFVRSPDIESGYCKI